jgi:hypothetical protein
MSVDSQRPLFAVFACQHFELKERVLAQQNPFGLAIGHL